MAWHNIAVDVENDGIAVLTVSRPEKLNALNRVTMQEIAVAIDELAANADVKGIIVTGAGEKAFIAGADISELAQSDPLRAIDLATAGQQLFRRIETLGKPTIAAVNGFALGGGLELAMSCTMRVASINAKFGQPEVKLGIIAGYGGTQRLPRLIGRGRALELLLTGEMIDAAEAHRVGLVNHVLEQPDLLDFCRATVRKIFANGPVAVRLTMQAVDLGLNTGLEEGLRFEATAFGVAAGTEDRQEGTRAFLEKRQARFSGR